MEKFEIIITTLFGLESLVAQEKYVVLAMKQLQLRTTELRLWVIMRLFAEQICG